MTPKSTSPPAVQCAELGKYMAFMGSSRTTCGVPPGSWTFLSFPSETKPSHVPSGEKNGLDPPSVPVTGSPSKRSTDRKKIWVVLPRLPRYATCRPSGDTAIDDNRTSECWFTDQPSGSEIDSRTAAA